MNIKIGLVCLSFCFVAATSKSIKLSADEQWKVYKKDFGKTYAPKDEPIHRVNFEKNIEKIKLNNEEFEKGKVAYKMEINSFTDMDPTDYNAMQLKYGPKMFNVNIKYPASYDWRIDAKISPVPNMGVCERGDWAFAAIGMLEGYLYKMDKVEKQLSVQDLIECSGEMGNMGCDAGDVKKALHYVEKNGISTNTSHPFVEKTAVCDKTLLRDGIPKGLQIKPTVLDSLKEEGLMQWFISSKSPITAQITAGKQFLQYKEGIFTGGDCSEDNEDDDARDYNVLIIGYGEIDSKKFWIVKNWKGEGWGEKGYAKVARGKSNCDGGIFSKVVAIENIIKSE